ncbi:unnamed protein product [Didymodactylos carnosus]|uniref:Uncharacterized protein n=1 Tax=Didymodactylos carnosus TaxID=1234261 RepID=A0A8S2RQ65_9BILA|nr:unnamed protein product [Didymodactylos carnosus]CAF4177010.1 unnamed protein product [Didymodactylos carnosus]
MNNLSVKFVEDNRQLFDAFVQCVNSSDGSSDYLKAVKQHDTTPLSERNQFLLFTSFNFILENVLYDNEF